jgi:hypothetical protein
VTNPAPETVPEILRSAALTYEQRNTLYADNYKRIGPILQQLFPTGIPPMDAEGWVRFGLWFMQFSKCVRYAMQLRNGGHVDSAHDACVYSAMLQEMTRDGDSKK